MHTRESVIAQKEVLEWRSQFPLLERQVHGKALIYLDNAATTQKPNSVIEAINDYYKKYNSNIHRGAHALAAEATVAYEAARESLQKFINARSPKEINFTRGTTESVNLLARAYGDKYIAAGDEILISGLEHHSNIVPWQMLAQRVGAELRVIPVNEKGEIDLGQIDAYISDRTKLVSISYISNALGTINPVKTIIEVAHRVNAVVHLDAAQAAPHKSIDVQDLDCDFLSFSAHKMYGPTGIGVFYGKEALLESMDPFLGGGEMIKDVSFEKTTYNDLPYKFEAGTPNISGAVGFKAAVDYLNNIGLEKVEKYEQDLLSFATDRLRSIEGFKMVGNADDKAAVISFLIDGIHPYDVGVLLDQMGIAIRTGHHCCQPLMDGWNIPGTCRASLALYNTEEEIEELARAIEKAKTMLS